jgi:predicted metalloprotease with PDZ domain
MTKQEMLKRRRIIRLAIPAVVCLAAIAALAIGTKVWQNAGSQTQAMELRGFWLGMRLAGTDSRSAEDLGVPPIVKGVVVADVQPSSRAVLAGLAPGDVLTRIDGKDVTSLMDLYSLSTKLDVGRQFQVDILRAGRPMAFVLPPPETAQANAAGWYGARPVAAPAAGAVPNDAWGSATRPRTTWPTGQ